MSDTQKPSYPGNSSNVLSAVFVHDDKSLATSGFLDGLVGRKIVQTIFTTTIANDSMRFNFSENGNPIKEYTLIFTDGSRSVLLSVERTA
jgi:hypothetical protein